MITKILAIFVLFYIVKEFIDSDSKKSNLVEKMPYLIFFLLFFIFADIDFYKSTVVMPWDAVTTTARVTRVDDNVDLERVLLIRDRPLLTARFGTGKGGKTAYQKEFDYEYEVDGEIYFKNDVYTAWTYEKAEKFSPSTIQITYDVSNPSKSIQGEPDYMNLIIDMFTIMFFVLVVVIFFVSRKPLKESDLNKSHSQIIKESAKCEKYLLKVIKVEVIDYEREKVFFEDTYKNLYYYETDFGEEFKENKEYEIELNKHRRKRIKLVFNNIERKTIQILNTEKKEFIEKT